MSAIDYKVHTNPSAPSVKIGVSEITSTQVTAKLEDIEHFTVLLDPAGNVGSKILSGILWPIAEAVVNLITATGLLEKLAPSTLNIPTSSPIGYKFEVEGVTIDVTAQDLKLSGHDGMLMAAGTVKVD